jgi:N-acetylglucosaminyldiphosphoundecaprenol N-acetyl-beta-D-mannosaminyltransferase
VEKVVREPATKRVSILGVPVDCVTRAELIERAAALSKSGSRHRILYVNIHALNTALGSPAHLAALRKADLVYCDGSGVKLGAALLGKKIPERMTGADWIHDLCREAVKQGLSLFFLGGRPGVAEEAATRLRALHPGLIVKGCRHGYFDREGKENDDVIDTIAGAKPDILLVGLGSPAQEIWIDRNFERLAAPVTWAVGALVDFVSGRVPRAPRFMLEHGLEWLYRLAKEPRRMSARYLIGNPLFFYRILRERFQR